MASNVNTAPRAFARQAAKFSRLLVKLRSTKADSGDFGNYLASPMAVIQMPPGQTGNALEVQSSTGAVLASISNLGAIAPAISTAVDATFTIQDNVDATKLIRFECSGVTGGNTRVLTAPDYNATLATLAGTETLTNKTLTAPKVGTAINDSNGNEIIKTPATATAVNEFTVTNAATGTSPQLSATGDDADISIKLTPKGAGKVVLGTRGVDLLAATTLTTASDQTYAVAAMVGGILLRDPNGGARADKLPTAANLLAAVPGAAVGSTVQVLIRNFADAGETITLTGADGSVTLSGSGANTTTITIGQNNSKILLLVFTNVGVGTEAYTAYSVGTFVH